jgi:intraflagellar transport protein 81
METQLKELRQAGAGATPEGLLQKMEEETNVNTYIVTQKLPKEIASKKKVVESLMRVTELPALGKEDVSEVKQKEKYFVLSLLDNVLLGFR